MLGGEVVEGQQFVAVLDQAFDGLGVFRLVGADEQVKLLAGIFTGLGLPDVVQRLLWASAPALRAQRWVVTQTFATSVGQLPALYSCPFHIEPQSSARKKGKTWPSPHMLAYTVGTVKAVIQGMADALLVVQPVQRSIISRNGASQDPT